MTKNYNNLLSSEFSKGNDWNSYSVYDVIYDSKLADHVLFNSIILKTRRNH